MPIKQSTIQIKRNLGQFNLFIELDNELIKKKQTIEKLINDYKQKSQELLDYIDLEYSDPQ